MWDSYTKVDTVFFQQQIAVLCNQVDQIAQILGQVALRLDELQGEMDRGDFDLKIGLDTVDDEDTYSWCDCPECRDDRSYRMD